jgi:hypothetical protein
MSERIYFEPGKNPPFPGYEAWLEEVKRAPIWQAKAPRQYVPDMRDGLGKELFPPPPPRSNLEPKPSKHYDRDIALAAVDFIWEARHDLIWERLWAIQYGSDDPSEGLRTASNSKYNWMHRHAITYEIGKKIPILNNFGNLDAEIEIVYQIHEILPFLPITIRRAPWVGAKGLMTD